MTLELLGAILVAFLTGGGVQWLLVNTKRHEIASSAYMNTAKGKAAEITALGDVIDQLNAQREIDKREMVELQQRVVALETQLHITVCRVIELETKIAHYQSVIADKERLIKTLEEGKVCATMTS